MAFFPGLYDSRGQLCFVNPTMQSRTCLQLAVLPHWTESRSCAWQVCKVACLYPYSDTCSTWSSTTKIYGCVKHHFPVSLATGKPRCYVCKFGQHTKVTL